MSKGETGQLRLLTGLVLLSAAGCLAWASVHLEAPSASDAPILLITTVLVAVGVACSAPVRVRTQFRMNAVSTALLVAAVTLPPAWAIACATAGIAVGRPLARHGGFSAYKALHNGGKEVLAAAAATYAVALAGVHPALGGVTGHPWTAYALALVAGAIAIGAVEELVITTTVAVASRRPWGQVFRTDLDIRVAINVGCLLLAAAATALVTVNPWLLLAIPLAQLSLFLLYTHRLHLRAERQTWERLAAATDALSTVDLTGVLHTAAKGAVALFGARHAQVELWDADPPRLVRADHTGVGYDGPGTDAPDGPPPSAERVLGGRDGAPIGTLRLALPAPARLSAREESTLRAYAASLTTAIHNARAYAHIRELADRHHRDARIDPLTGLPNRRHLLDLLDDPDHAPTCGKAALALVDLNRFKEVNDTLGHAIGDQLLVEVAGRLNAAAEAADATVARLGGDEFAIVLHGLPAPATAVHRARRILDCLRQPVGLAGMQVTVQASAGVALTDDGTSAGELLRRADVAMYQAKRAGVPIVEYQHGRDTADHRQLSLGGELVRALGAGEFVVHFQPIVDLGSGEAIGAEALTRWEHPRHGVLQPDQWLAVVERSDQLATFAAAVLRQALAGLGQWHAAGYELSVAVNVSPHSLLDPRFAGAVLDALRAHRTDPGSLVLELAETTSLSHLQAVGGSGGALATLRAAGVRFALDDFGTGYSSLSRLGEVPVHELKVDRSFVAMMGTSAQAAAAVRSTVELARTLGLDVIAEGVESVEQRRALWELGCTSGQGYLFGKPMPAEDLLDALRAGSGALAPPVHRGATVIALRNRPTA
ncbi:putative bifunctional diguanylate cyclase/phosphodiesterase [Micromonospora sp. CPCC 206061]|uniref:putative bifunctional diguanylate cyclase/phosphodiesterase n=1 Tax=Micromonospora sp. CPCC 206061 TaxID=3122410 RepID=UPI002FF1A9F7